MVIYMMKKFGFIDSKVNLVWGVVVVLIYVILVIGGWIGDKLLGMWCIMLFGVVVLVLGYVMLWIFFSNLILLYSVLGVIVVGNGFFKFNVGNFVCKIYEGDDIKIDSVFIIYYMVVNVGLMILMIVMLWICDYVVVIYGDNWGWYIVFGVCVIGLLFGLINYLLMYCMFVYIGLLLDS